jgi:hypothetical protein
MGKSEYLRGDCSDQEFALKINMVFASGQLAEFPHAFVTLLFLTFVVGLQWRDDFLLFLTSPCQGVPKAVPAFVGDQHDGMRII